MAALARIVLGAEVRTTAARVICVFVAGLARMTLSLNPRRAHFFVFWFAFLSKITPSVCGVVFIAQESWLRVVVKAMAQGEARIPSPRRDRATRPDSAGQGAGSERPSAVLLCGGFVVIFHAQIGLRHIGRG